MADNPKKSRRSADANRFYPGKVIGPLTITALAVDHPWHSERQWWVRYACCGLEAIRNYRTLMVWDKGDRIPGHCAACDERLRGRLARMEERKNKLVAEAQAPTQRRIPLSPGAAWPRPALLSGQRPGPWGDLHGLSLAHWLAGRHPGAVTEGQRVKAKG